MGEGARGAWGLRTPLSVSPDKQVARSSLLLLLMIISSTEPSPFLGSEARVSSRRGAPAGARLAVQDLSLCFFRLHIVLYYLEQYLHLNRWPMCTSFQCLFSTLRLRHTCLQVGQVLVFGEVCVLACEASFSPKLLGPP